VQLVSIDQPRVKYVQDIKANWSGKKNQQYVEFIIYDWRNKCIAKASTDPTATTNYFDADCNELPFELSAAFFRPEVLSKYKSDREKYRVTSREVDCRASWNLKCYDVNDAGQVHAYICDLRALPYAEQLHWASHNEEPKAGISSRAVTSDFLGQFTNHQDPRDNINNCLARWTENGVDWWTLQDEDLLNRGNTPLTSSKDEWGNAFLDLSQLIVEGVQTKVLRAMLTRAQVAFESNEQSIRLMERIIKHTSGRSEDVRLVGLRMIQSIRNQVKGHVGGSEAEKLVQYAIGEHGSYAAHFRFVCEQVVSELMMVERACALL
jgi:hypothetical protein